MSTWKMIARPEPRGVGQRFFVKTPPTLTAFTRGIALAMAEKGELAVYVADNSGSNPDLTEDGPLELLREHGVTILRSCASHLAGEIRLSKSGSVCATWVTLKEAEWLAFSLGLTVHIEHDVRDELQTSFRLFRASGAWEGSSPSAFSRRTS